jgi:hypothetical protein
VIHFQRIEGPEMPTPVLSGREIIALQVQLREAILAACNAANVGNPEGWFDRFLAALHAAGFDVTPFKVAEQSIFESSSDLGHG